MKKFVLVSVFIVGFLSPAKAQETSEFKTETIAFIKLTGAGEAFKDAINQIGAMVSQDKKEAYTKEASGTLDEVYSKMADLYMAEFTYEEIQVLVSFYNTDLGKKLATKQMTLTQKAMMFGQSWGMEVQAIAQKYM